MTRLILIMVVICLLISFHSALLVFLKTIISFDESQYNLLGLNFVQYACAYLAIGFPLVIICLKQISVRVAKYAFSVYYNFPIVAIFLVLGMSVRVYVFDGEETPVGNFMTLWVLLSLVVCLDAIRKSNTEDKNHGQP